MNWRLVVAVAVLGVAMGAAQVLGLIAGFEGRVLLAFVLGGVAAIGWREPTRGFRHGFAAGMISGSTTALIQAIFYSTYSANNPLMVRQLTDLPLGLGPATFILLVAPLAGLFHGVVLGLLSWAVGTVVARGRAHRAAA